METVEPFFGKHLKIIVKTFKETSSGETNANLATRDKVIDRKSSLSQPLSQTIFNSRISNEEPTFLSSLTVR